MAVSVSSINVNPAGGASAAARGNAASLKLSLTSVTIGVAGDYTPGATGTTLTAQQLGMDSGVLLGLVTLNRTVGGAQTAVTGRLDCTNPAAPVLRFYTASAEVAAAGIAGAQVDVFALGF